MYQLRYTPTQLSKAWAKHLHPVVRWRWMRWLDRRNQELADPVVQEGGAVVSLTTFGQRWSRVHYTIESIGSGRVKPSRLLLWVAPSLLEDGIPEPLKRLQRRGLEILSCDDVGPHTKYFPAVNHLPLRCDLVTADDDVLYPLDWLERLRDAALQRPEQIVAHRARTISFLGDGQLAPYVQWRHCNDVSPSPLHFALGVGGVLYPPVMQHALRDAGDGFRLCCPRADDVWLKVVALHHGVDVCQIAPAPPLVTDLPGTKGSGLARHNVSGGGNDEQIRATFDSPALSVLREARLLVGHPARA